MSDGILCKKCGWQETDHDTPDTPEEGYKRLKGYKISLVRCSGFVGESEPPELTEFQQAVLERRARERAAWGQYAACIRQSNFDSRLAELDEKVRSNCGKMRQAAKEERDRFFREGCRENERGIWIG